MATLLRADPTFYASPRLAMQAPPETVAYVIIVNPGNGPDGLAVVDADRSSKTYGTVVGSLATTHSGDELHHFGWNACSSSLCPYAAHPHVERRYLLAPGIRSSRIYVIDTKPDPRAPRIVKTIEPEEIANRAGYSRPHTSHCGPDGIYVSALGSPTGDGPGGIFIVDHDSFEVRGRWELDRGPQYLAYDFWWHLGFDTMITSEWGTPKMIEDGVNPDILIKGGYGHQLHIWDLPKRRHRQVIDLGAEQQMVLELRPAHDPSKAYGFVGVVTSLKDLSASVWAWHKDGDTWKARKVIEIRAAHPTSGPLNGGPQMVEVSRDGKRVYVSNGLYKAWDDQFYPDGLKGWVAKLDAGENGGFELDRKFFVQSDQRFHQVHLEGGDASSDSYCFA